MSNELNIIREESGLQLEFRKANGLYYIHGTGADYPPGIRGLESAVERFNSLVELNERLLTGAYAMGFEDLA